MKKKFFATCIVLCMILQSALCFAQDNTKADLIILFENDVHCAVDGYPLLSALKEEMKAEAEYVGVVSSGDFIQGGSLGVVSKGGYIVDMMNLVGYDAVTLGNHEFDYKIPRLVELAEQLDSKIVCSNFKTTTDGKPVFDPYTIVTYGDIDVAYVGITTPGTLISSSPAQFLAEDKTYKYSFSGSDLYETVQKAVDDADKAGADYIIALTHLGTENEKEEWMAQAVIQNTTGIDAVLDGHSHSVVEHMLVENKEGISVPVASTGTAFANVGKLVIEDGAIQTELIPVESLTNKDAKVTEYIEKVYAEMMVSGDRKIGETTVRLAMADENGTRLVRNTPTNLGDLCADAYRAMTGADVAYVNGGGIRANIEAGEVTFNHILNVFPYNNTVCIAEATGQQILDMMELGVINYPKEDGSFPHVSGIRFNVNPDIPSSVVLDENLNFVRVDGDYRVQNLEILNKNTGAYEPIVLDKVYTYASHNYFLIEFGGGATMFKTAKVTDTGVLDVEVLEDYITNHLHGVIGDAYKQAENRVNILDAYIPLRKTFEGMGCEVIWTEQEPQKIVVRTADAIMIFMAGTNTVTVGDVSYEADRAAYIEDGVTYISADCIYKATLN